MEPKPLQGKVALITGAARGQGRSHAVRLARDGADIVACDLCEDVASAPYGLGTEGGLGETVEAVEELDRQILARPADVRSLASMEGLVADGLARFGRIDIVLANAGITSFAPSWELTEAQWDDLIGINLTGAWKTTRAAIPAMIEAGEGGAIVLTGSTASFWGIGNCGHYVAAKHGVLGLARTMANELAPHFIRVNTVCPTTVDTEMIQHEEAYRLFNPELENPGREDMAEKCMAMQSMPIPWVEPGDVSAAIAWLVSDEARYVTGIALPVDGGALAK
jgi:SDR family mycofactocin-dependent oxidoreductase